MEATAEVLDQQLAQRLRELRAASGLSLEALSERSGVSRSMISLIERAESSPTAATLHRLAAGLGVTMHRLFSQEAQPDASPLARRAAQPAWRDPDTGYTRRRLSPEGWESPLDLLEVVLPPGARVQYDGPAGAAVQQQLWLLEGALEVRIERDLFVLARGDCLAMRLPGSLFRNPGERAARYVIAACRRGWA